MLNKKQIQAIFLFDFKMGWKPGETTHNISNIFGPGTANKCAVQWWFKKFCKGEERFEDEELSGQPSEVDNGQLRAFIEADPLKITQFSSVQFSRSVVSDSLQPHELQHARPPCPSPTPGVYSNSCPSSWWCHPAISSSVFPFSSCPHPSQHQGLFQWVNSSHEVAKVLEFQLQLHKKLPKKSVDHSMVSSAFEANWKG